MTRVFLAAITMFAVGFGSSLERAVAQSGDRTAGQTAFSQQMASAPAYNTEATSTARRGATADPPEEPAPMPDADIYPPVVRRDNPKAAELAPHLFRPKTQFRGDGYSPGSTAQERQEHQLKPAPGISLKVPLD